MSKIQSNQLHRITTFMLASLPVFLSMFSGNKANCAEKQSAPNIVVILMDDKYYTFTSSVQNMRENQQ